MLWLTIKTKHTDTGVSLLTLYLSQLQEFCFFALIEVRKPCAEAHYNYLNPVTTVHPSRRIDAATARLAHAENSAQQSRILQPTLQHSSSYYTANC